MQALDVGFLGLLSWIAVCDFRSFKVPFFGLFAIVALAFLKTFLLNDMIFGFTLMFVSMSLGDMILGRETLGGGDIWLGTAMSACIARRHCRNRSGAE